VAQKKGYSRYFIILQQDENGYSVSSDKLPSGYTKLETKSDKCKITYYVQNIKKELEPYYMVLICSKKDTKKIINLGEMNIDEYGRAEITYEYNTNNIAGSSLPIDVVTGAAIIKQDGSKIISVMSGFAAADPPSDWRSFPLVSENRKDTASEEKTEKVEKKAQDTKKEEPKVEQAPENPKAFEEYERKIEELKQLKDKQEEESKTNNIEKVNESGGQKLEEGLSNEEKESLKELMEEKARQELQEKIRREIEEKVRREIEEKVKKELEEKVREELKEEGSQKKSVKDDTQKPEEESEIKKEPVEEDKTILDESRVLDDKVQEEIEYPLGTVGEFFRKLAQDFEKVDDICTEIKRCNWYRVKVESIQDMNSVSDYNKYTIIYYPMMSYYPYISKYKHYLLGYKYDKDGNMKYIVYGIPGTRNIYDQPYGGKTGFVTWVSENEADTRGEQLGYWLMFYDFKTSTVVVPARK